MEAAAENRPDLRRDCDDKQSDDSYPKHEAENRPDLRRDCDPPA